MSSEQPAELSEELAAIINSGEWSEELAATINSGEWSEELPATQWEQDICDKVKPEDLKSEMYEAFAYRTRDRQLMGQYDMKVYLGGDQGVRLIINYLHVSLRVPLRLKLISKEYFRIVSEST